MPSPEPQSAAAVLMVRPARFGFNPQTADSNAFQRARRASRPRSVGRGLREFDGLADALRRAGVQVIVAGDTAEPAKPDALFPNNWVSFHRDGTVVLYPMLAANRRRERREDVIDAGDAARAVSRHAHRGPHATAKPRASISKAPAAWCSTAAARVAYAGLSPRTDLDVLGEFAQQLDYELVTFEAHDAPAVPIYHTNVLMAIGARFAVVCGEAIMDAAARAAVFARLRRGGHDVVDIARAQMREFAGNMLELAARTGHRDRDVERRVARP